MTNKISIIIPVIRPKNIPNLKRLIKKNAGIPRSQYEILTEEDTKRIGAPKMVKKLTEQSKYSLVMFIGDDCLPQPDFLKEASKAMESLPGKWGLVGLNDMQRPADHSPTHWLAHKKLLEYCEEFFHTGYIHQYCDNELHLWAALLNQYVRADNAKIFHDHVGFRNKNKDFYTNVKESDDEDLKRVYGFKAQEHDRLLFERRKQMIINKFNNN